MSSRLQPNFVSPSLALFVFAFCTIVFAENAEQAATAAPAQSTPNAAKITLNAARELVELMADRLELAEAVAQQKWNAGVSADDDAVDALVVEASARVSKESGVDPLFAEPYLKSQMTAFKERQRQLFASWKKSGVDGFDEVPEMATTVVPQLEKNLREQLKRIQELKPVLCSGEMIKLLREMATGIFARRALDKELLNPIFEPLDVESREKTGSCPSKASVVMPAKDKA